MTKKAERTITIDAPPERVFKAWVEEMNQWWTKPYYNDHDRIHGLYMEPKLGGRYIEKWDEDGGGFLIGTVVEWLPPLRLAYTWTERGWGGINTLIRIDFVPDEQGCTRMTFIQEGFERLPESDIQRDGYDGGCKELIGCFKAYLEKG